ncbi:tRNA pseudouridine(38-40) synthase TruA [Deinococcus altitudinis]|uniref:tRNA pseudouridine(38-40) synthase TruA n=1 Tax=Deinococcus altitudinis TaxID=468914 RepID=UPI0038920B81
MQPESTLSTPEARAPRLPYAPPAGHTRCRLEVQWDGAGFVGWQSQPGQRSVQDTLQAALEGLAPNVFDLALRPVAAGRTDTGVHAENMTLHWDVSDRLKLPPERLIRALNGKLPPDLSVLSLETAAPGFHARYSCTGRSYVYRVLNSPQRQALWQGRALHVARPLDTVTMQEAAQRLVGDHDFAAFATREERQTRRTLYRLDVRATGYLVELHLTGESFLRQMVRGLVGTLLQVGRGELTPEGVSAVLASRDRAQAGPNVSPQGLYFAGAHYVDIAGHPQGLLSRQA